jgi:hypothetical protein
MFHPPIELHAGLAERRRPNPAGAVPGLVKTYKIFVAQWLAAASMLSQPVQHKGSSCRMP